MIEFERMSKKTPELSVFFPAYNEEENIRKTVTDAKRILLKVADVWEIIVVDDGSSDKTEEVVKKLSKKDERIRLIKHKKNRGYGGALKTGYEKSKYKLIAFTDSDGQFDFSEITKFLKLANDADLVLGYRLKRADSIIRKIYTRGWAMIPRVLFGMKVTDYSCGFKLIKSDVYQNIQPLVGEEKVTQIEMLVKAKRQGFKFAEVGVHHYPRVAGTQTGANIKVVVRSVLDLLKLWMKLR